MKKQIYFMAGLVLLHCSAHCQEPDNRSMKLALQPMATHLVQVLPTKVISQRQQSRSVSSRHSGTQDTEHLDDNRRSRPLLAGIVCTIAIGVTLVLVLRHTTTHNTCSPSSTPFLGTNETLPADNCFDLQAACGNQTIVHNSCMQWNSERDQHNMTQQIATMVAINCTQSAPNQTDAQATYLIRPNANSNSCTNGTQALLALQQALYGNSTTNRIFEQNTRKRLNKLNRRQHKTGR